MLPSAVKVDYHASCFCHHRLVDVGHVCSVCLSSGCALQFTCHFLFVSHNYTYLYN
ncbi:General transcription factor IIH subunit 3 [Geodia barretti]|uniref:General transcription factor IIH subunit 3 n=1 Tax=Geodia barretti TaxID=519541 RepID=A0AA35XCQ8_GEOBA|nr:General transcription factor IIH subunit 3 [Geodia barretti]